MGKLRVVSVKMPQQIYNEMILRIPKNERSAFIREAIIERLQKIPKADKILELEQRLEKRSTLQTWYHSSTWEKR
jgi:metal-responsive CopG/Arc/MetJ family transcriptional regulator